jgi:acyl-CoA thioester hydrolase
VAASRSTDRAPGGAPDVAPGGGPGGAPGDEPGGGPFRRGEFPVLRSQQTRWHDNDHYGHVNNVVHYAYFDTAVNGYLMDATGTDIRELDAIGLVVETGCRYLAPVSFPEQLWVGLAVERLGSSSITYRLGLFREEEDEPTALARFVHVYVDRTTRRSTAVPSAIRTAVEPLVVPPP